MFCTRTLMNTTKNTQKEEKKTKLIYIAHLITY